MTGDKTEAGWSAGAGGLGADHLLRCSANIDLFYTPANPSTVSARDAAAAGGGQRLRVGGW
ncbi:hypothetical protein KCP74_14115 [Salmonella enterica subsp. enterica]|nr:hypothetical protein KCP74_14115 [Salmonella enterica subsp. enterica]